MGLPKRKRESHPAGGTPFAIRSNRHAARQVFWLSAHPGQAAFPPGRSLAVTIISLAPSPITAAGPPRICTGFRDAWATALWPLLIPGQAFCQEFSLKGLTAGGCGRQSRCLDIVPDRFILKYDGPIRGLKSFHIVNTLVAQAFQPVRTPGGGCPTQTIPKNLSCAFAFTQERV
jgi:hypothetical protein